MADDPKKDAKADEKPEGGGGKSKLMIVLVIVNMLVVAGAGAAVFLGMSQAGAAQPAAEAAPADDPSAPLGPLVEITTMVVNLSDEGGTRYMRASFHVEAESEEAKTAIEGRMVPIRSAILLYLSGLSAQDTLGPEARTTILEAVQERVQEQAGARNVRRVYAGELVVQ